MPETMFDNVTSTITWATAYTNSKNGTLVSDSVTIPCLLNTVWRLSVQQNGHYAGIYLSSVKNASNTSTMNVGFTITFNSRKDCHPLHESQTFESGKFNFESDTKHGFDSFISWDSIDTGNLFVLKCKIWKCKLNCFSKFNVERIVFTMPLECFSALELNEEKEVPTVLRLKNENLLRITLQLKGQTHAASAIFLTFKIEDNAFLKKFDLQIRCIVSVQDKFGSLDHSVELEHNFLSEDSWNSPSLQRYGELSNQKDVLLPKDVLTLHFDLSTSCNKNLFPGRCYRFCPNIRSTYKDDFQRLHSDKSTCDVTLVVGEAKITAHKNILSTRSPVFRAMFETEMSEAESGKVVIEDLDPDTVARLVLFAYCDKVDVRDVDGIMKLYVAADKYQVQSLKEECSSLLKKTIATENACSFLELAYRHQDADLKQFAKGFFCANANEVLASPGWERLMEEKCVAASFHAEAEQNDMKPRQAVEEKVIDSSSKPTTSSNIVVLRSSKKRKRSKRYSTWIY